MSIGLIAEAADYLDTLAEDDERARELSRRIRLVADGIEEAWPHSTSSDTVEWTDPRTGAAVVSHRRDDGWEMARFAPGEEEPTAGDRVGSFVEAVECVDRWLG